MNNFLIPANSKKSMLIFGIFTKFDLILFLAGLGLSLLFLMILPIDQLGWAVVALVPGLLSGFLILPVPNYHNVLAIIRSMWSFFTTRQKYIWKGWCFLNEEEKK